MKSVIQRRSYFIRGYGRLTNLRAFQWLLENAKATGKGFVAVHVPQNLNAVFDGILQDDLIRRLKSKGKIAFSGVEIERVTRNILPYGGHNSPLVAFHPSMDLLKKLDSIPDVSAILAVPVTVKEIEKWIGTWNASELTSD